jgi:hypothetical protein
MDTSSSAPPQANIVIDIAAARMQLSTAFKLLILFVLLFIEPAGSAEHIHIAILYHITTPIARSILHKEYSFL